ncbi:MAG: sigma-70 family RNA polymerase sigma factor [Deltaproteobacteria bacterium]|nr:sigma-70 family RNA polymerase sigma factor [Deltaproteobacteria bacterium]
MASAELKRAPGYWCRRYADARPSKTDLGRDDEIALVRDYQRGDVAARNKLVSCHLRLVQRFARDYARYGSTYNDLMQEGSVALLRASETFALEHQARFSTYASYWIRARMQHTVAQCRSHRCAMPASHVYSTRVDLAGGHSRPLRPVLSLDAPVDCWRVTPLGETVADPSDSVELQVSGREAIALLRVALARVILAFDDWRVDLVCKKRLLCDEQATLETLGGQLHVSREGVRLLEQRVLRALKIAILELATDSSV